MITQTELREVLTYHPETGRLVYKTNRGPMRSGARAGCLSFDGYRRIKIGGNRVPYLEHRLIFFWMTGWWPEDQVDHINGERDDNRWDNLRNATSSINQQNQRHAQKGSAVGVLGVKKHKNRFIARIYVDGMQRHLGIFDTKEEAHQVYLCAKRELHQGCTI